MSRGDRSDDGGADGPGTRGGRRWVRWLVGAVAVVAAVTALAAGVLVVVTRNPSVPAFYDPPDELGTTRGAILREEPVDEGWVPAGARAWRVLHTTTDPDGDPIAVSGLVLAPTDPGPGPHPVLAWAHGTTGIARPCAPSLSDDPLDGIPDLTGLLAAGWVVTLTDYPGLGTPGPHPYLVGESAGRSVLDSVRAAHALDLGVDLDDRYAIWGHSQGGHAALFAGQLAPGYLPEQDLVGVVALAPVTDLEANLALLEGSRAGGVLVSFVVASWTALFDDLPDDTLTPAASAPVARLTRSCTNQPSRLRLLLGLVLPDPLLAVDPTTDPAWTRRLAENRPDPTGVTAPLLVGQGDVDQVIAPDVTAGWVDERCAAGAPTTWRSYPGDDHLAVVVDGGTDATAWTVAAAAGDVPGTACP